MEIGDLVAPIKHPLRSGASIYANAVCISVEPFILVSHGADMRWQSTVELDNFKIVGRVNQETLDRCMKRL